MTSDDRLNSLKNKHQMLEEKIEREEKRPQPDDMQIHKLKKQKLLVKDEMAGLVNS